MERTLEEKGEEKERKMASLDTQRLVDTLREAGESEVLARAHVDVLQDTLEGVATSADIKALSVEIMGFRAEMKAEMKETRAEMKSLRAETKAEMKELRAEMKELRVEMKSLRAETKAEMKELRAEMRSENKVLGGRIDSLEGKIDNLRWTVGVGLTATALWVPSMIFLAQILFR